MKKGNSMNHKYTATLHLEDEGELMNEGNDIDELMLWMAEQAEVSSHNANIRGEVVDNATQNVVKRFHYET